MSLCTSIRGLFTNSGSSLMIRKLILSEPGVDFLFTLFRVLISSKRLKLLERINKKNGRSDF